MNILAEAYFNMGNYFFPGRFNQALSLVNRPFDQQVILNNKTAAFINIDRDNLLDVYRNCPHLALVLNKQAEMLSNGCLKMRKKSNKDIIEKHPMLDLMKNPNPLQSQREFIYEYSLYRGVFSNNFVYSLKAFDDSIPKTITNLPSGLMRIVTTGKLYDQTTLDGIIEKYELMVNSAYGTTYQVMRSFSTKEVMHTNTGLSRTPYMADSKLIAMQMVISNIIAAYKTRNILITENAGMTIISSSSKDSIGAIPMADVERERVENQMRRSYGLRDDQMHKVIASSPLSVTPLVFPVDQMKLFEEVEDDFSALCGAFGMDRDLFPSTKGATFENKKQGEIATYNGIIQTEAIAFCNFLDLLLLKKEDAEFFLDYSHIACMQADKKSEAETRKINIEANAILFANGVISDVQFAELADVDNDGTPAQKSDSLGKIPLALQQLALAIERANTAGDSSRAASLTQASDLLTERLVQSILNPVTTTN